MPESPFIVVEENPNDTVGGGGCLCDPLKVSDCRGPFVVVPHNDMDCAASPHVVVGAKCAHRLVEVLGDFADQAKASRHQHERGQATEQVSRRRKPRHESTEVPEV